MVATTRDQLKFNTLGLFREYGKHKSIKIRNKIVQLNIGLAQKEAQHWSFQCPETYEDLLQVACLGLLSAVERFECEKGNAFSSFAVPYIKGKIQHYLRDKSKTLRIPRRWMELEQQANSFKQKYLRSFGRMPSDAEICIELQLATEQWQEIKFAVKNQDLISLDMPVNQEENIKLTLGESIPHPNYRSFQLADEDRIRLQMALEKLEEKTKQILEIVFLQDLTQKQAAEIMGISAVTVSRQVKKGIESLKSILSMEII
jgi:RNA polymerase sigma-B factor